MVEVIIVVRGSGTKVGKVTERCEEYLPKEGSSKSGAVTLRPGYVSAVWHMFCADFSYL